MTALPKFTIRELLEAGVHFGHKTMRWNPRMAPYLFGSRNGTHIIDLQQTAPLLHNALNVVYNAVKKNGRVLFVGTKRQAQQSIADAANRCGQYYVNHRWLGGMLTNWNTVSRSIKTLRDIERRLEDENITAGLKKKEVLSLQRRAEKLRLSLGGILDMGGKPDVIFIIDTNKESLALKEAKTLGVPVIAVADSNSDPSGVDYLIPGNDDATRAIELYCKLISDAALAGVQDSLGASGVDIGALEKAPTENITNDNAAAKQENKAAEEQPKKKATAKKSPAETKETAAEEKPKAAKKAPAKKSEAKAADKKESAAEEKPKTAKKAPAKKAAAKKEAKDDK